MKTIKFRIVKDGKVIGYEKVVDSIWYASQDDEEWFPGVFGPEDDKTVFVRQMYIGLNDKNDTEIYEGDVVEVGNNKKARVIWDELEARFMVNAIGRIGAQGFDHTEAEVLEVVAQ